MQHEIIKESNLLDDDGMLVQEGYAKHLILNYNRKKIKHGWWRIKEWDYYGVFTDKYGISVTYADLGLYGLINIGWLDFKNKKCYSVEDWKLLTRGNLNLPRTSQVGNIVYRSKKIQLDIIKGMEERIIKLFCPRFDNGRDLKCNIVLEQKKDMDTMVVASSWKEDRTAFYYNQKINCMPATGVAKFGDVEYRFDNDLNVYAVLDWGRGVWPYKNIWYWGSASGKTEDGHVVGWNLGYGFSDRSSATENMIFYDGVAHKLEDVKFIIPTDDVTKPWKFTSNNGRFEMDFEPVLNRPGDINLLILRSVQTQVFGYFTGDIILDDGKKIHINRLFGFAERVYNRW